MYFMKIVCISILLVLQLQCFAQGVGINTSGAPANASSLLDVASTTKGVLIPRMSLVQRNAIAAPATGLLIYQTDDMPGFYYYNGAAWQILSDNLGNHIATQNMVLGSNYLSRSGTSGVGLQFTAEESMRYRAINSNGPSSVLADRLRVDNNGGLVAMGDLGIGIIPQSGPGSRMMWYPFKSSFRAGAVDNNQWDDTNNGFYSMALGYNTIASGVGTFAGGDASRATAQNAFTFGNECVASGTASIAMGATAWANGFSSTALGYYVRALGQGSIALGYRSGATTDYSVAIGYRAVAKNTGALVLADASTTDSVLSSANNQFNARYAGGYRLYTNATKTVGVSLAAGGNAWVTISDSAAKEKFAPAEAESFLQKLQALRLGSWNYKGQSAASYRHYGPMAQEIFSAYGKDKYGSIGNDTTLNSADMDGIMMILLQGLEKRTTALQETNQQLQHQLARLTAENDLLQTKLAKLDQLQQQVTMLMAIAQKEEDRKNLLANKKN